MASVSIVLNSGTDTSSGGNSGYRLATGTSAVEAKTTTFKISASGVFRVTAISVPWFGYSANSSAITASGSITCTLNGATFTGSISSGSFPTSSNRTGTASCTGSVQINGNTNYTLSIKGSGGMLVTGMRLCTNGKTVTATYLQRSAIYYNAGTAWLP